MILSVTNNLLEIVKNDNNNITKRILIIYLLKNVIVLLVPLFHINKKQLNDFSINFISYFKEN